MGSFMLTLLNICHRKYLWKLPSIWWSYGQSTGMHLFYFFHETSKFALAKTDHAPVAMVS